MSDSFHILHILIWFDQFLKVQYVKKLDTEIENGPDFNDKLFNQCCLNVIFAALFIDRFTYKSDRAGPKHI